MVEITIFTDSLPCASCYGIDMHNGLKKFSGRWYCKKCLAAGRLSSDVSVEPIENKES